MRSIGLGEIYQPLCIEVLYVYMIIVKEVVLSRPASTYYSFPLGWIVHTVVCQHY